MRIGLLKLIAYFIVFTTIIASTSCGEKEDAEAAKKEFWKDTIYLVMKEIYLWNDALPSTYDARKYSTPELVLKNLMTYKKNPKTMEQMDRYSFLDERGDLAGEIGEGEASGDYGFMVRYMSVSDVYITYVYKNSPAGKAGIERGWKLIKVNGNENIKHDGSESGGAGVKLVSDALFESSSCSYTFLKPNGETATIALTVGSYSINSVLYSSIITLNNGKKAGYVVFNYFLDKPSVTELSKVIADFESNGVSSVIVDLRYNGGGAVSTADYLINSLSKSSDNKKVMYTMLYNQLYTDYFNSSSFKNSYKAKFGVDYKSYTLVEKSNSLSPEKLVFIVSGNTASASELTINSLKPYYGSNLKLIGKTTYGKPCGFWAETIGIYDLYAVSFETVNSQNSCDYYTGMTPDENVLENPAYKWGDQEEPCLASAIAFLNGYPSKKGKDADPLNHPSLERGFKGLLELHPLKK
jgi:carboxyl-terminal processing protease